MVHPLDVGVVLAALTDYSQRQLADTLNVVEAKVGKIKVGFVGDACTIADKAVDAELTPANEEDAHHE